MNTGSSRKLPQVPFNLTDYGRVYDTFTWAETEKELDWVRGEPVNIAYTCVDRHVRAGKGERTALLWDNGSNRKSYTFNDLSDLTNRFANGLKKLGVRRGERVVLFLPSSPEFHISLLGVVKAGAIAVPLHSKIMDDAVQEFLLDSEPVAVITTATLRPRINHSNMAFIRRLIVVDGDGDDDWQTVINNSSAEPATEWMQREDPMLLLYTSGSTGASKGVVHVHEGALQCYQTGRWVLDMKEKDVFWCNAVLQSSVGSSPPGSVQPCSTIQDNSV